MSEYLPNMKVDAEIHGIDLMSDNCFRLTLKLEDESYLELQWPPDTPEYDRVLEFISALASDRLAVLGGRGIVITGPTEKEEDDEE